MILINYFLSLSLPLLQEQRESEIKTKALANKKSDYKCNVSDEKSKNCKKFDTSSTNLKLLKGESKCLKKNGVNSKKENNKVSGDVENDSIKKIINKNVSNKDNNKQNEVESNKKEQSRPSTRSRQVEEVENMSADDNNAPDKKSSSKANKSNGKKSDENFVHNKTKNKGFVKTTQKKKGVENGKCLKTSDESERFEESCFGKSFERDGNESQNKKNASENKEKSKENGKKGKKVAAESYGNEKDVENKNNNSNAKETDGENSSGSSSNKRPTRKCSAADKICFEIDGFTSDDDDFLSTFKPTKPKGSVKKIGLNNQKQSKSKKENKKVEKILQRPEGGDECKKEKQSVGVKESTLQENVEEIASSSNKIKEEVLRDSLSKKNDVGEENIESKIESTKGEESDTVKMSENQDTKANVKKVSNESDKSSDKTIVDDESKNAKYFQNEENKEGSEVKKLCDGKKKNKNSKENTKKQEKLTKMKKVKTDKLKNVEPDDDTTTNKRTRPVRQCSTKEKKWIETDSDFSFYDETSDDEDDLPILGMSFMTKERGSEGGTEMKETITQMEKKNETKITQANDKKEMKEKEEEEENQSNDNFSESDEEPLKKKALIFENETGKKPESGIELENQLKSQVKPPQREVPDLHPLKKSPGELSSVPFISSSHSKPFPTKIHTQTCSNAEPVNVEPKVLILEKPNKVTDNAPVMDSHKNPQVQFPVSVTGNPKISVPNRIEMILHSLKKDKVMDKGIGGNSNDVKVTFGKVPYQPLSTQFTQIPCNYQMKPIVNFPHPREPISTHGLDLLSEVALPTTSKEKYGSQTERIEKWLKDSVEVEQRKTYSGYENVEYKPLERDKVSKATPSKSESPLNKPVFSPPVCSYVQPESPQKFSQMDLVASQKLLKKNIFSCELRVETNKMESQPTAPKKALTSVQDLLKLQKEKKEMPKSPKENSPHLKNCKCNSCVVKKGWFKNKPIPNKAELQKLSPIDDVEESAKPFQSLTKAFSKVTETKNSKVAASVAPIVLSSPPLIAKTSPTSSKECKEKKGIFQQKKLSFLERMKERERKEIVSTKPNPNAFSPNNESSVYAFEPEPEQSGSVNAPFRSKMRESRTSSVSKSDDDGLKLSEDESSATVFSPTQVSKPTTASENKAKAMQSTSIAVQVNLDSESVAEVETVPELPDGKSIEISTQTEVSEEEPDSPMFYIPLQQATTSCGSIVSADQQLIQGVALKLGTEGPLGPNQRVVMKAKLVTKPPDTPSMKAVVMPQPKRIFDQKSNNPPIGTVQPTTRKPPAEPKTTEPIEEPPVLPKDLRTSSESQISTGSTSTTDNSQSKSNKSSSTTISQTSTKNKEKAKDVLLTCKEKEMIDDPSPSSSASSSKSKKTSKQKNSETVINPSNNTSLPPPGSASKLVEAPTFHATEKDFQDPFEFFDRIRPAAEKFGLCRIVPPSNFKPDCKVSDDMRFTAYNQYIHRMFHRWGPNIKEMMAIKKYLGTQSISLKQPPWIGGIEVDLPRLYQSVQNCGGLMKVMEKKKWHQVADMMKIPKAAQDRVTKLDDIYCKYLLPYDTLSHDERQKLFEEVEKDWAERQKSSESSDSQNEDDDDEDENYIEECEECVVKGRNMALNQFYRIARNTKTMWFKNADPSPRDVETEFWKHVSERNHHVCVHSGSIDSSGWGYGFPIAKNNSFSKHPWNLKVLTNNSGSVLRSLGPVMGVTVPTLHVGMVFTAFCWYRDPHGLPWIEYLHTGAPKIWYGISDDNSSVFQDALRKLIPRYIKNKTIWLPSDTAMIPPSLLVENGVSLCHSIQEPGQFILVFPRAFISSICTGYLVSESVYFAQPSWLTTAEQAFKDIQESCEPSMFSLEKLLFSIATDFRTSVEVLKQVSF